MIEDGHISIRSCPLLYHEGNKFLSASRISVNLIKQTGSCCFVKMVQTHYTFSSSWISLQTSCKVDAQFYSRNDNLGNFHSVFWRSCFGSGMAGSRNLKLKYCYGGAIKEFVRDLPVQYQIDYKRFVQFCPWCWVTVMCFGIMHIHKST